MALQTYRQNQILQRLVGTLVARADLSDITTSSQILGLLTATSVEIEEIYFQMIQLTKLFSFLKAEGSDLDRRALEVDPSLRRRTGTTAVTSIEFSRTDTVSVLIIPIGTLCVTVDGREYATTVQAQMDIGQESVIVTSQSTEEGSRFNAPIGTITVLGTQIPGVVNVTNTTEASGGLDQETDADFRARILDFTATLTTTTPQAIEGLVSGLVDPTSGKIVRSANIVRVPATPGQATLFIDDGSGTAAENGAAITGEIVVSSSLGNVEFANLANIAINTNEVIQFTSSARGPLTLGTEVFLDPTTGQVQFVPALIAGETITANYTPFINLVSHVQRVVNGDPTDRVNFPGFSPAGVAVQVLGPEVVTVTMEIALTLDPSVSFDTISVEVENAVISYINNLGLGDEVVLTEVIRQAKSIVGVFDLEIVTPLENIIVSANQIARASTNTILIR